MIDIDTPIRRGPKSGISRPVAPARTTFQIHPAGAGRGFELSGPGLKPEKVLHSRLIDAIVQAAQIGRQLEGAIQIFDRLGQVADILPLPNAHPPAEPLRW